jgi:AraC family transcriptional regulator, regulatory protein of adaptative response / methylated-DNA-[protein]-cysteine methyltransferase
MQVLVLSRSEFTAHCTHHSIVYTYHETPAGKLLVYATDRGIFHASFQSDTYAPVHTYQHVAAIPVHSLILSGTEFEVQVWRAALAIPHGTTISYSDLAQHIGNPHAVRAVARALAKNNIAYFIPCHRIIGKDEHMRGYRWGIEKKIQLLQAEGAL